MDCEQIADADFVTHTLQQDITGGVTTIYECLYRCYFTDWENLANKRFIYGNKLDENFRRELIWDVFQKAVEGFIKVMQQGNFKKGKASLKTFFLRICHYTLLDEFRKMKKGSMVTYTDPMEWPEAAWEQGYEKEEQKWYIWEQAFIKLGEPCASIIKWRKYEEWSSVQIAEQVTSLSPNSVNEKVHRCTDKLATIVRNLKNETGWN